MSTQLEALTIFCGSAEPGRVIEALSDCECEVDNPASSGDWETVDARFNEGSLVLVRRMFQPGSEFARIILGAHNHFRQVPASDEADRERVLAVLESCDMMLGIRVAPPMASNDRRYAYLLSVTSAVDGLLFDEPTCSTPPVEWYWREARPRKGSLPRRGVAG